MLIYKLSNDRLIFHKEILMIVYKTIIYCLNFILNILMFDALDICLTQQDFQSQDAYSIEQQSQMQEISGKCDEQVIEWIPAILRPVPFANLFALASEATVPNYQSIFSGVRNPSLNVIYKTVKRLRQLIGNIPKPQADKLIYQFYGEMIEGALKNTLNREYTEFDALSKTQVSSNNDQTNRKITFGSYIYHKKAMSYREQRRFKQKQVVARSFCNRDYGTAALEQEMAADKNKIKVYKVDYKPLLLSILIETLRRTQQFLCFACEQKIKYLSRQQVKQALNILLQCRDKLKDTECLTLFKMIKTVVGIGTEPTYELEVLILYNSLNQRIKELTPQKNIHYNLYKYQKNTKLEDVFVIKQKRLRYYCQQAFQSDLVYEQIWEQRGHKIHEVWCKRYEQELMQAYLKLPNFESIDAYFRRYFPKDQGYFSTEALRSRLHQILYLSLCRLQQDIEAFRWKQKYKSFILKASKKKIIIHSPDGEGIRKMLIQYYRVQSTNREQLLANIIHAIEEYIYQKQQELSELFALQKQLYLSIVRKQQSSADNHNRQSLALSIDPTIVQCFVSPQIEAGLVCSWLQPQYE